MDSGLVVDSDLLVGSLVDSQSESKVEPDSEPGSAIDSGFLADFDSAAGSISATSEHFQPSILLLAVEISQQYDQVKFSMYMNTASVGNIYGNV